MSDYQSPQPHRNRVQCQSCNKSFGRAEHLHRHILTHTNEKPHVCSLCGKGFTRSDILNRHIAAHESDDFRKGPRGIFRACLNCRSARAKCSGTTTCQRCAEKILECQYPLQMKRRAKQRERNRIANDAESMNQDVINEELSSREADTWPVNTTLANDQYEMENSFSQNNASTQQQSSIPDIDMLEASHVAEDNSSRTIFSGQGQASIHGPNSLWIGDVNYQQAFGTIDDLNTNVPYVAPMFSNRIPGGELAEMGCSTINWLSPLDMNYTQFMFENQYLPVDVFTSVSLSGIQQDLGSQGLASPNVQISSSQLFGQDETQENPAIQVPAEHQRTQSHQTNSPMTSNYSESASTPSRSSTYYVDGASAREPRYGKLGKHQSSRTERLSSTWEILDQKNHQSFYFPVNVERQALQYSHSFPKQISESIYSRFRLEFRNHCLGATNSFSEEYFPPPGVLDLSIHLYFEYFHPVFPILHRISFIREPEKQSWLIFLAISSIGISFLGSKEAIQSSEAFLEFVRRALDYFEFSGMPLDESNSIGASSPQMGANELSMIQARILNVLGMFHSCNDALVERAFSGRSKLVTICLRHNLLDDQRFDSKNDDAEASSLNNWKEWIFSESRNRTGYCIWWLDSMLAYQSDYRPQMRLDDAKNMLPCPETIWEAPDETKFQLAQSLDSACPPLLVALQGLYKKKTIDSGIGEFSRVLLIHGLYRRTWEVANYHTDTLSNWIPSAPGTRDPSPSNSDATDNWLPGNPAYSKWRNSACDCLDILHWSANSLVARRAGLEHPTMLHLHLARLILLTPAARIQSLASKLIQASKESQVSTPQSNKDRKEVMRWFIQDQYKARLAIVHAGAIFWHVRRYSHDSMLEPFAVFIATLVLWVYATSSQAVEEVRSQQKNLKTQHSKKNTTETPESRQEEDSETEIDSPFINLDRLCDDELIQTFVLHGTRMTGYVSGVGNICKAGSTSKILKEGVKILARSGTHLCAREGGERGLGVEVGIGPLPTWGVVLKHAAFLEELGAVVRRRDGTGS